MPHNTEHWDSMKEYEKRIQELREQAEEEGIAINEDSINNAMSILSDLTPAQGGENPSRLMVHKSEAGDSPQTETPQTEAPETEAPETEAPETEAPETAADVDEWKIPNLEEPA